MKMFVMGSGMKKIAVFTSHVYEQMSGMMQKGLIDAAKEFGVKLIFFASFGDSYSSRDYCEFSKYDKGDRVCFDIPDLNDFDGVIKISTYFSLIIKEHLKKILSEYDVPVINIGGSDDDHLNVRCDDTSTFAKVVEHVVKDHGCKNIYHLAGEPKQYYTGLRLNALKDVLAKNDVPFDDGKVYYGTLWFNCGEPALDYILEDCKKRGTKYPDAVVCANDYSAIGLMNACKARGIRIPEDFIITGFDAVAESKSGFPTLTTAEQPFYNIGYTAITTMLEIIEGKEVTEDVLITGNLIRNQSCGCQPKLIDNVEDFRVTYIKRLDNATGVAQSTTNLMLTLSDTDSLEECFKAISDNAKSDTGFKDMLLCLAPGWDKQRIVDDCFTTTDEMMTVVSGFRGDEDVPVQTFRKKDILPQDMLEDPNPYYIFALHHLEYYMGYLIATPELGFREQKAIQSWFVDLGVILDIKRIQRDLNDTVSRLEFLYNRDMLTELYNRRGLEEFFNEYFDECMKNKTGLAVIIFDMDNLKSINDNYGHNEGDYGIKTIAYAMQRATDEDEICARSGGDEFVVVARNYTAEKAAAFIEKVRAVIGQKVLLDEKEYDLGVSTGVCILNPDADTENDAHKVFENCLKEADSAMYIEKKQHKAGRNSEN